MWVRGCSNNSKEAHRLPRLLPSAYLLKKMLVRTHHNNCLFVAVYLITVTSWWVLGHLKLPALRLFPQPVIPAQIKKNIKAPRHWPLWGKCTGDQWIPCTKGQESVKCLYLMTSSCYRFQVGLVLFRLFFWTTRKDKRKSLSISGSSC